MERLRVLTFNIWNRQGPWDRRLPIIRQGIEALSPDVIGLQEVLEMNGATQAHEIADGLDYHIAYASAWEIGGGLHFGNALLSRYPFVTTQRFPLPVPGGEETRCLLYGLIDAPCGHVPVFNTHLSWKLHHGSARIEQIQAVAGHVKALTRDAFPPVLMGDFNADPDSDEMRYLRGLTPLGGHSVYFNDCWLATRGDDPAAGMGATFARSNAYAASERMPSRRIDYIYVRGPDRQLRGEPLTCRLAYTDPVDGVFASDHYGVYAEIQAAPRPLATS